MDSPRKPTELFLAFDNLASNPEETLNIARELSYTGEPFGAKFNLDAMLSPSKPFGATVLVMKQLLGRTVFADIKMWNGSRTMESVVKTCVDLGVDFVNVYALADTQLEKAVIATEGSETRILALTVLSHYNDAYCQKWFGRSLRQTVSDFSRYAIEAGCHGILLPGTTLDIVRDLNTIKVATGLRPKWYKDSRHEQEATPAEVAKAGADYAVCGSPVLKQPDKEGRIAALKRILDEMRQAVGGVFPSASNKKGGKLRAFALCRAMRILPNKLT